MANKTLPCPCGSDKHYRRCCRPLHLGQKAPSAEALMRSRYSAYAMGRVAYLIESTHPDGPHWQPDAAAWRLDLQAWCQQTRFEGLTILDTAQDPLSGQAWVTFHAQLSAQGQDLSFTERSRFAQHAGRWKYLDGETPQEE